MILHKHVHKEDELWEPIDPMNAIIKRNLKSIRIKKRKKLYLMSSTNFDQP
jgi:hypothetical protein